MWRSSTALGCLLLIPFTGCTDPNSGDGSDDGITTFTTGATSGGEVGEGEAAGESGGSGEVGEAGESSEATTVGDGDGDATTATTMTTGDGDGDGDSTTATTMTTAGDGDGDGDSGDGDGDGDASGDTGCFNDELSFNPIPPSIVLVLDKSGSMSLTYDHDGNAGTPNVSRWNAVHLAVQEIFTSYDAQVEFGVKLFPNNTSCGVNNGIDVACAPNNAAAILSFIPGATDNVSSTGTPSGEGLSEALDYLTPLQTQGAKAMIFMADGDVSCGTPSNIPAMQTLLSDAFNGAPSIPTYVVGINASGTVVGELNDLAVSGGVPVVGGANQFYDTQNQAQFFTALDDIIGNLVSCDLVLDPPPPFPDNIDVNIGGVDAAQLDPTAPGFDCATQAGWYYSSPNVVRLCGPTCDTFNNLAMPTADITYFCTPG